MGAHGMGYTPSDAEHAFIRKAYEESTAFLTICGGFMARLQAGLLHEKTVTGPRPMLDELKKNTPGVNRVEKRWA
jgi:putative intracellular protease/amidase